jgi:hypothetical protein
MKGLTESFILSNGVWNEKGLTGERKILLDKGSEQLDRRYRSDISQDEGDFT